MYYIGGKRIDGYNRNRSCRGTLIEMDKLAQKIIEAGQNKKFEDLEKLIGNLNAKKVKQSIFQCKFISFFICFAFIVNSGGHTKTKPR